MIDGLKPYPAMKDSGVPWLGEVPAHWEVRRLRNVADLRVSNVDKNVEDGEHPVRLCNYVDVYKNEVIRADMSFMAATASEREIARFRLRRGDVLITKDSEDWQDIGVPAYVAEDADDLVCGYHLAILRPFDHVSEGKFLYWQLRSEVSRYQFSISANGITRYGLSQGSIKEVLVPLPPLNEQRAIVRFLDHADRLIRRYIGAKRKLIRLLEEQKQAVIHRAVTRGLDPNVRLKPSGVEWLGNVPAHWEGVKLRHCASVVGGMTPSMSEPTFWGGDVPWVTPKDMKKEIIEETKVKVTVAALAQTALRLIPAGSVLMVVRGMILARRVPIALTACPVTVNQDMKAIVPTGNVLAAFLARLLSAAQGAFVALIDEAGHGTKRFPTERWQELSFAFPPRDEQVRIVDFLRHATADADNAIAAASRELALLQEYHTRLIADVVTGKLDVRAAAAALPEPDETWEDLDTEVEEPTREMSEDGDDRAASEVEAA